MENIFQRVIDNNFSELAGLTVDASIPVPESMINEIIASVLRGNRNISSCRVTIHPENRVSMALKFPHLPWTLPLKLKLFRSVDLTHSPKIRAFLENNILLGKLGSLFNALPEGVTLYDDQITVDIGPFLSTPEQKKILDLFRSVEIRTEEGKVIFDVKIAVDEESV
jgi:hypothetical protein